MQRGYWQITPICNVFGDRVLSNDKTFAQDVFDRSEVVSKEPKVEDLVKFTLIKLKDSHIFSNEISDYYYLLVQKFCQQNPSYSFEYILGLYSLYLQTGSSPAELREIPKVADKFSESISTLTEESAVGLENSAVLQHVNVLYNFDAKLCILNTQLRKQKRSIEGYAKSQNYPLEKVDGLELLFYELEKLKTSKTVNVQHMQRQIIDCLVNNKPLQIVHIKCLRYLFTKGSLEYGTYVGHIENIEDKSGNLYIPMQEDDLFNRIQGFRDTFTYYGVPTRLSVLLADNEIEMHSILTHTNLETHLRSVLSYAKSVKKELSEFDQSASFVRMSELVDFQYLRYKKSISDKLYRGFGVGAFSNEALEHYIDRMYESFNLILTIDVTRADCRDFTISFISELLAQKYFYEVLFEGEAVLIQENMGEENYYLGSGDNGIQPFSVFFTKLRERNEFPM